ncbi:MAG: hypothetical protein HC875_40695 [Anaerolineales bacterium]|nr:hypothetical protein [Anaerolineales bacterium]
MFFSRIAGRGGSKRERYNHSETGGPGFMFVDSSSGYSGGGENYDSDYGAGDDSNGDSPDYDAGGSYDSGSDSSSSSD